MAKDASGQRRPNLRLLSTQRPIVIKYKCIECGTGSDECSLVCLSCGFTDTMVPDEDPLTIQMPSKNRRRPKKASDIDPTSPVPISTGRPGWDEALGGGLVLPSTVLISGPKGTGKSTAALAIAARIAKELNSIALYGSAEMPGELVRAYADRAGVKDLDRLYISEHGETEELLEDILDYRPVIVVWDSIQRFKYGGALGETELANTVNGAIHALKTSQHICLMVSHVNKEDEFVGRSSIGHDVDVILELSRRGDTLTIECPEKNRFAETPRMGTEKLISGRMP